MGRESTKRELSTLERDVHVECANQRSHFRESLGESQAGGAKDGKSS